MTSVPFDFPDPPTWDGEPRGPVTEAEALVVHQRSWVLGRARTPADTRRTEAPPTAIPTLEDTPRVMVAYRVDPESLAYARARATLEGTTMSETLDRLLRQWAAQPPGWWPTAWGPSDPEAPELPGVMPPDTEEGGVVDDAALPDQ